jgi:phosphoglycerate kinase
MVAGVLADPIARTAHAAGSDRLKVGLVGCGGRGTGAASQAISADPGVVLWAVADAFAETANTDQCAADAVPDGWMALDIGPKSIEAFRTTILGSRTILWNGPMGVFEMKPFQQGTIAIANAVAEATQKGAFSLVGGGDSVAAVNQFGLADKISYVSTGGGAMLEYLEGKVLPGIAAVQG